MQVERLIFVDNLLKVALAKRVIKQRKLIILIATKGQVLKANNWCFTKLPRLLELAVSEELLLRMPINVDIDLKGLVGLHHVDHIWCDTS
jgi:hypothetical protein